MNWRGDPSTAFSRIKNVAVEFIIYVINSRQPRESTLNLDERASLKRGAENRAESAKRVNPNRACAANSSNILTSCIVVKIK